MSKLIIFFGWTIPLIQIYLPLAFKEWWKSPIFRRKPGGCLIFRHVLAFLMPDANHGQCFAPDTGPCANRQAPHYLIHSNPATLHTPGASPCSCHCSSPLLIPLPFRTLPPSTPAALFSPTARCSLTFLRSAHRAALCVCLTEHTVRAHFGHTHIQQGVCTVAPMSTHTYIYSFIKLIDMHSWAHTATNVHTDFHMCTLYTHSSAYTGCLTPRPKFQYLYSFFYASTRFLQFDLLIPWALQIFSPPLFPQWDRWYGRCFIVIGLWSSYIKEINLYKLPTTLGKTQQKYWWRFF